jgi:DNA polymerase-3 subunit alpha (Gram-positive type)
VIKKIFIKNLKLDIEIQILCYKEVIGISSEEVVNRYWMEVVGDIVRKNPLAKEVLASKYKKVIDNKVVLWL